VAEAESDPRAKIGDSYRRLFESPDGQFVLMDLLNRSGVLQTSMVAGEPHMTAYREGRRSIALEIIQLMQWSEMELVRLSMQRTAAALREMGESGAAN
jgi:hypothetical protein